MYVLLLGVGGGVCHNSCQVIFGQLLCLSVWMLPYVAGSDALMESQQDQKRFFFFGQFSRGKGEAD